MSFYAHRVSSFKLLTHVNRLMGVVHTTCRTTMLIAMYFGEYPIYPLASSTYYCITNSHALCPYVYLVPFTHLSICVRSIFRPAFLSYCTFTLYFCTWLMVSPFGVPQICSSRCVLKIYLSMPPFRSSYCTFTLYFCTWLMVSPFGVPFVLVGVF